MAKTTTSSKKDSTLILTKRTVRCCFWVCWLFGLLKPNSSNPKLQASFCKTWIGNYYTMKYTSIQFQLCKRFPLKARKAKSRDPWNLVPGHFWSKIRTFFRGQRFKDINLKWCCGFVKNRFKWMSASLHFYLKHHNVYSYNPLFSNFVQIYCPDISESESRFPDKKNLFACL